jgi:hypothetical protein
VTTLSRLPAHAFGSRYGTISIIAQPIAITIDAYSAVPPTNLVPPPLEGVAALLTTTLAEKSKPI